MAKLLKFKLLAGGHVQGHPTEKNAVGRALSTQYKPGDTVVSEQDLVKRFGPDKFLFLGEATKQEVESLANDPLIPGQGATPLGDEGPVNTNKPPVDVKVTAEERAASEKAAAALAKADKGKPGTVKAKDVIKQYEPLDKMTLDELKEVAETEEIDLKGATKKDEIIKALRGA